MYLRHLHVQNVKLLRDVKIDFVGAGGRPRMWTVFVGENRSCKTTLLQTIAAAASGSDQATHLATDVVYSWPDLRRSKAELSIDATFELGSHVNILHDDVSLLSRSLVTHLELNPAAASSRAALDSTKWISAPIRWSPRDERTARAGSSPDTVCDACCAASGP